MDFGHLLENVYSQIAYTLREKETLERELRPHRLVLDHFRKVIITMDDDLVRNFDGIQVVNAIEFLLG